jgi:hypothetical protein
MASSSLHPADDGLRSAWKLAFAFALLKLCFQFALTLYTTHIGYSYFRDEFYYIACGRHLAWGYVDHGPIVALQARLGEMLFGDSVFAIRVFSALAGALTVFLGGMLAWALGGRRSAQALAMLGLLLCPQYIGVDGFLSMNSFEAVFWSFCLFAVVRITRGGSPARWWMWFGLSAGLGMLNKPSMAFFLVSLGLGLLVTRQRRILWTRWTVLGLVLMAVLLLPYVHWQIANGWPTLEFLHNGRTGGKSVVLNPLEFTRAQIFTMGPVNAFLWVTGIVAPLRARSIADSRWLGLTYVFFFALMCATHAKDYYLEGIYPAFFAAGAIAWEQRFAASHSVQRGNLFAFPVYESLLIVLTLVILPMCSPVLRPAAWVRYTTALHLPHDNTETLRTGPLPQFFADRFGWDQEVSLVARAFQRLSPREQQRVCIFGNNYGEAGAIDFLGRLHHDSFPPALSPQNNYWLWGTHGCDPNISIAVIHDTPQAIAQKYQSVTIVGTRADPYSMPFEHGNVYLLRGRRPSAPFDWRQERFFY